MTTEKEIKHAAYSRYCNDSSVTFNLQCNSFTDGAKWALSQPQIIEIFGKRVKAVVGDDSCENCVFQESVCKYISRGNLCQSADKKFNRHFVEVDEDGNEIKQ